MSVIVVLWTTHLPSSDRLMLVSTMGCLFSSSILFSSNFTLFHLPKRFVVRAFWGWEDFLWKSFFVVCGVFVFLGLYILYLVTI